MAIGGDSSAVSRSWQAEADRARGRQVEPSGAVVGEACVDASIGAVQEHRSAASTRGSLCVPSNTQRPSSSQGSCEGERVAVDWLGFTGTADFGETWERVRELLEEAKEGAQSKTEKRFLPVMGALLEVKPYRWPFAGRTHFFEYTFSYNGIEYGVALPDSREGMPHFKIDISGFACTVRGWEECYREAIRVLGSLGLRVRSTRVMRLDVAIDLLGQSLPALWRMLKSKRVINRLGQEPRSVGRPGTGTVSIGRRDFFRVKAYNKLHELACDQSEEGELKYQALVGEWGGRPSDVTRVEFEMGGAFLRDRYAECELSLIHI